VVCVLMASFPTVPPLGRPLTTDRNTTTPRQATPSLRCLALTIVRRTMEQGCRALKQMGLGSQ